MSAEEQAARWRSRAACRGLTHVMYPEEHTTPATIAAAKAVCAGCPVKPECREAGAAEPWGVWAGDTATERYARNPDAFASVPVTLKRNLTKRRG